MDEGARLVSGWRPEGKMHGCIGLRRGERDETGRWCGKAKRKDESVAVQ